MQFRVSPKGGAGYQWKMYRACGVSASRAEQVLHALFLASLPAQMEKGDRTGLTFQVVQRVESLTLGRGRATCVDEELLEGLTG